MSSSTGGGGGGGGGGGPTPVPSEVLYVRQTGSDTNTGKTPDEALQTVVRAVQLLQPGVTVYVGPGHYPGRVEIADVAGTAATPGMLVADTRGEHTGDAPGDVVLDANGDVLALRISKSPYTIIDGFSITGANPPNNHSALAVQVRTGSHNSTIRNCVIDNDGPGDGIGVLTSNDVLIFNNLIVKNGRGIRISDGSQASHIIGNTIADNMGTAVAIGGKDSAGVVPTDVVVLDNIIQDSADNISIDIDTGPPSSLTGYMGNFNLVFIKGLSDQTSSYRPSTIRGDHDVNRDASFVDSANGDYHLAADSPAVNAGTADIGAALVDAQLHGSTSADGAEDKAPVDLGYHYPVTP
jgi:hypothetical protein